jgi:hypothetical protein
MDERDRIMDKYRFIEDMLNERYDHQDVIYLREVHLQQAICSFNFRNHKGIYYWHRDSDRITEAKPLIIIKRRRINNGQIN